MSFSKGQLEALWIKAGGPRSSAGLAAAIALAESSGNPNAENHNTNGSIDRGLWQINTVHGSQSTFDVMANARAAVAISNGGTNFSPWVTFNTGAYQQYLSAPTGSTTVPSTGPSPAASPTSTGSSSGSGGFSGTLEGLGVKALVYLGMIAAGGALLWYGTKTSLQPKAAAT